MSLTGTPRNREEYLFLKAWLAFQQGDITRAQELCGQMRESEQPLSYRDRIRLQTLTGLIDMMSGDPGARPRLAELAAQVADTADLAAEIWRALALHDPAV